MSDYLSKHEVPVGHVVYLVEDHPDGPRKTVWCERTERGFEGGLLGGVESELPIPNDDTRIEHFARAKGFRSHPDSWQFGRWLIVDTETTGLEDPAIVELGAVIMQEGEVIDFRSGLYNPGKPIHPEAEKVHGITNEMVRARPRITDRNAKTGRTPAQGIDRLAAEHDVQAIVAYNGISFDFPLIRKELGQTWAEMEDAVGVVIDPLVVVRLESVGRFWKGPGRHKLTAVAERFQLTTADARFEARAHRAVWDCVLAGRILWHLREHVPLDALEARGLMAEASRKQQQDFERWLAKQPPKAGAA